MTGRRPSTIDEKRGQGRRRASAAGATIVDIGGRQVRLTSLDRVLWPATGTTKGDLLSYVIAVAPALLPHLARRPVMLWRYPEGVDRQGWFQAQCRSRPDWVPTHSIVAGTGELLEYCLVEEAATLAWLANLGTIEFHPHGWRVDRPSEPVALIFDLDPGRPAGLAACAAVALRVRERLEADGLATVVKTSGRAGLHVAAPLLPGHTFGRTKAYAKRIAEELEASLPGAVIARSVRSERAGRVYVDWLENHANRQLVAPYSPRATAVPQVSTPLTWTEVEATASGDAAMRAVIHAGFDTVHERLERFGDLWSAGTPGRLPTR
jgi:bifunctional non-homologous end joining protein LigD